MSASNIKSTALIALLGACLLIQASAPATAQMCIGYDPFSSIIPGVETLRKTLEEDIPGLVDRRLPFVFLPHLRAEARVRPLFINLSGGLTDNTTGQTFDFLGDLGYEEQAVIIQSMVRLQLSRLSVRGVYDAYLRTLRGNGGRFDWPGFYYGVDLDLYSTPCVRFGLDMDFYPDPPTFSLGQVPGSTPGTSVAIVAPRPATWGLHFVWNPIDWGTLSWSFETRARRSLRTGSKIDEVEVAAGILSPHTIGGIVGVRGGYRYTSLELDQDQFDLKARWSAVFGELVYYY